MSRRSEIYTVLYDVDLSPLAKTDFYTNDSPRISCNFQPLSLLWSYFALQWWSVAFGFLAVFFLIEAIWHYILTDYLRHIHKD